MKRHRLEDFDSKAHVLYGIVMFLFLIGGAGLLREMYILGSIAMITSVVMFYLLGRYYVSTPDMSIRKK